MSRLRCRLVAATLAICSAGALANLGPLAEANRDLCQSTAITIPSNSDRSVAQTVVDPRTFTWDAAGHLTGDGSATFTYDNAGRRTGATIAGQPWSYAYNAFGQRVKKAGPAGATTLFAHDEAGHLLGEYMTGGYALRMSH